jgi:hypothetical protein
MVQELYNERGQQRGQIIGEGESSVKEEGGGEGGGPSEPSSPSSSSSSYLLMVQVNILPRISILKILFILMICHY